MRVHTYDTKKCICTNKYLGLFVYMCMYGHMYMCTDTYVYVYRHICIQVYSLLGAERLIGFSPPKKERKCMDVRISAGCLHATRRSCAVKRHRKLSGHVCKDALPCERRSLATYMCATLLFLFPCSLVIGHDTSLSLSLSFCIYIYAYTYINICLYIYTSFSPSVRGSCFSNR